jgi:microcystin-dependent protein
MFSFPWTSSDGDRVVSSDQQRALHASLFGYGVLTDFAGSVSGSTLTLTQGSALVNGAYFDIGSTPETIDLTALSGTVRIILRFSLSTRSIVLVAISSAQELVKTAVTFELPIALVTKTVTWGQPTFAYEVAGTLADPVGSYKSFAVTAVPASHLICNGQAVSRITYARLFAKIGTTWGAGDGSTTFNLPDRRGKVGVGLDASDPDFNALTDTGGAKTHQLTANEMPSHTHAHARYASATAFDPTGGNNFVSADSGGSNMANLNSTASGGNAAHNNLQPYGVEVVCIRA